MTMRRLTSVWALGLLAAMAAGRSEASLVVPEVVLAQAGYDAAALARLRCERPLQEGIVGGGVRCASEGGFVPPSPDEGDADPVGSEVRHFRAGNPGGFGTPAASTAAGSGAPLAMLPAAFSMLPTPTTSRPLPGEGLLVLPTGPPFELLRPA